MAALKKVPFKEKFAILFSIIAMIECISGHLLMRSPPARVLCVVYWIRFDILGNILQGQCESVLSQSGASQPGLSLFEIFQAEESWLVGMVAIMAAMGTGELNAQDHLEPDAEGRDANSFREVIRVLSLLFFVIIIVTLYFNLLIGYAVSDIQVRYRNHS